MEIDTQSLNTVQGLMALGMTQKTLDFNADMANQLIEGSLQAADAARASQGIGTNVNLTV